MKHPNKERYPNQNIFIILIEIKSYVYLVPYIEDDSSVFCLKDNHTFKANDGGPITAIRLRAHELNFTDDFCTTGYTSQKVVKKGPGKKLAQQVRLGQLFTHSAGGFSHRRLPTR